MTSSYFQRCSDGFGNTEVAPDIGYHFIRLWCSVTGKTKALARKSVGSPSKETLTPAPSHLFFTACYMNQDTVEPITYLIALPLSSAAQNKFAQVLLKDECTYRNSFTVVITWEAEATVDWGSLSLTEAYRRNRKKNTF